MAGGGDGVGLSDHEFRDRERGMRLKSCRRKIVQQWSGKGKGSLGRWGGGGAQKITPIQKVLVQE